MSVSHPARLRIALACRLAVLAGTLLCATLCNADYDAGRAAFVRGDYTAALRELIPEANAGHPIAQLALGLLFARGGAIERNDAAALKWFAASANQGNVHAQYNLGVMYYSGAGSAQDGKLAVDWLRRAANADLVQAQTDLGILHFFGLHKDIAYPEAVAWLRKAAERGHPVAQLNLACTHLIGGSTAWQGTDGNLLSAPVGVAGTHFPKDEREAARWFEKAADGGAVVAAFNLGYLYEKGIGVEPNRATAIRWYEKSVSAGFAPAFMHLATLLESDAGGSSNTAKAIELRMQASRLGYNRLQPGPLIVWSFGSLASQRLDGRELSADLRKVIGWEKRGALYSTAVGLLVDPELSASKPVQP